VNFVFVVTHFNLSFFALLLPYVLPPAGVSEMYPA